MYRGRCWYCERFLCAYLLIYRAFGFVFFCPLLHRRRRFFSHITWTNLLLELCVSQPFQSTCIFANNIFFFCYSLRVNSHKMGFGFFLPAYFSFSLHFQLKFEKKKLEKTHTTDKKMMCTRARIELSIDGNARQRIFS